MLSVSNSQSSFHRFKQKKSNLQHRILPIDACTENHQIKSFDAGQAHTCAVNTNNQLYCWGVNVFGHLGLEKDDSIILFNDNLAPVDIGNELKVKSVHIGHVHTCVLLDSDDVKCFGGNFFGQLGYGNEINIGNEIGSMGDNLDFVDLGQGLKVKKLRSRGSRNCVIFRDNKMKCWGMNSRFELGYGDKNHRGDAPDEMGDNLPFVGDTLEVLDVALANSHTCILTTANEVKCFGINDYGQLGYGDRINRPYSNDLPIVDLGGSVKIIKCTDGDTCAVLNDNSIYCWGSNGGGNLGQGDWKERTSPVLVDIGSSESVTDLAAGYNHFCAILADKTVKCWGDNSYCQLGLGIINANETAAIGDEPNEMGNFLPSLDFGSRAVKEIKATYTTCVRFMNDELACFGDNSEGELGLGDKKDRGCLADDMGDKLETVKVCNTQTPSLSPSTAPSRISEESSISPSMSKQQPFTLPHSWHISYVNYTSENMLNSIQLEYNISKGKQETQFISSIYNNDCEVKQIHRTYWKNNSTHKASVDYCVKSELLFSEDSQLSVSFAETKIHVGVDLATGFTSFEIKDISVQKIKAASIEDQTNLKVNACICDEDQICKVSPTLNQNTKFYVCVMPLHPKVKIKKFQSVSLIQDGEAKLNPIVDGTNKYSEIASTTEDTVVGIFETRLTSIFFETLNPSDLFITGKVLLDFSGSRRLEESTIINNNGEAEFILTVNLLVHTSQNQGLKNIFILGFVLLAFFARFFFAKKPVPRIKYSKLVSELD